MKIAKATTAPEGYRQLARLGKTKGLKGGLRVYPLAEAESLALRDLSEVFVSGHGVLGIQEVERAGAHLVIFFQGIRRIEQAKALVNQDLYAPADHLPQEQNVIYRDALIGLPVWQEEEHLGDVSDVVEAGTQVLLRVGTHLLPLGAPYVVVYEDRVELHNPPEGLLDLGR